MIPESIKDASNNTASAIAAGAALATVKPEVVDVHGQPVLFVPDGFRLENLSGYLPSPSRLSQFVSLVTPKSFCDYVNLFGQADRSIVFAQPKGASFVTVLDYHANPTAPSWNGHKASCVLQHTAAWKEWTAQNKQPMSQADFAQFLEDHIPDIAEPAGAVLLEVARNFEAKKAVTFQSIQRISDGSVQFAFNEDVQGTPKAGAMKVPTEFTLVIAPFEGSEPETVVARLRYRIGDGGKLSIWYDLIRAQEVLDRAFNRIYADIEKGTKKSVRAVVIGSV